MELDLLGVFDDQETALLTIPQHSVAIPTIPEDSVPDELIEHDGNLESRIKHPRMPSMVGKVGRGHHGDLVERQAVTLHARACKERKKHSSFNSDIAAVLNECQITKDGHHISMLARAKSTTTSGVKITIKKRATRGNRFVRSLQWSQFLSAAYSTVKTGASNVASAARLGVHRSTVSWSTMG